MCLECDLVLIHFQDVNTLCFTQSLRFVSQYVNQMSHIFADLKVGICARTVAFFNK